ncbi:methyl-accepting chemotaxis protein [Thioalkalivibrio sulfidiphilus]|uniref:methyl-accepting chemotaxis protein n=1 Tax=Thioalkalivibrio sulfidiphilus TaxID=1033854 RepID=UPI000366FCD0|nr:methyl-accepting chemotaxis protein [Thioalkalivibrio sulfidiphilus]
MSATESFSLHNLHRHGDLIMVAVCWFLLALALALAGWHSTWTAALVIGLPAALVPTALLWLTPGSLLNRLVNATALMVFSALIIHQSRGMIEMHFAIFVLLAFLLYYRDWLPLVTAAAVIAVHHLAFNWMQEANLGVYIFEWRTGLDIVFIHAGFVVFETALLVYMAVLLRREAVQSEELHLMGGHMRVDNGMVDLTFRNPAARSPLARGLNDYVAALHDAIRLTRSSSHELSETAQGLAQAAERTDRAARDQQAETQQIASAVTEMEASAREVAHNAQEAAAATREADTQARSGREEIERTVAVINELARQVETSARVIDQLEQQSDKVGGVLEVIQSIAEQTNLLALNAAIEAARAGEQGRGFAVVADEVRTLASRTQDSTQEIRAIIEQLQGGAQQAAQTSRQARDQAEQGVTRIGQAGQALRAIADAIGHINDMNMQIASAAQQQTRVTEAIAENVNQVSEASLSAANQAAESRRAVELLLGLSRELEKRMGQFKTE